MKGDLEFGLRFFIFSTFPSQKVDAVNVILSENAQCFLRPQQTLHTPPTTTTNQTTNASAAETNAVTQYQTFDNKIEALTCRWYSEATTLPLCTFEILLVTTEAWSPTSLLTSIFSPTTRNRLFRGCGLLYCSTPSL